MVENTHDFWTYLKLLLGKWILWLFVALDVVGLVAHMVFEDLVLPLPLYWILAVIGLVWAGFEVYRQQNATISKLRAGLEGKGEPKPELLLELVAGSEYDFDLLYEYSRLDEVGPGLGDTTGAKVDSSAAQHSPPLTARIVLHAKVSNIGPIDVDVVDIGAEILRNYSPWKFGVSKAFEKGGSRMNFPLHLCTGDGFECDLKVRIWPQSFLSDARFASRLSDIRPKSNRAAIRCLLTAEAVDDSGNKHSFNGPADLGLGPLKEKYLKLWEDCGFSSLLRLARGRSPDSEGSARSADE